MKEKRPALELKKTVSKEEAYEIVRTDREERFLGFQTAMKAAQELNEAKFKIKVQEDGTLNILDL